MLLAAYELGYGPNNLTSFFTLLCLGLTISSFGYGIVVSAIYGYDLSSLKIILYLGSYFFIKLISKRNASFSDSVTIYSNVDTFEELQSLLVR